MLIWIWRVQNQVTRQIGEYLFCLASMKPKSLASLASMNFSKCRTLGNRNWYMRSVLATNTWWISIWNIYFDIKSQVIVSQSSAVGASKNLRLKKNKRSMPCGRQTVPANLAAVVWRMAAKWDFWRPFVHWPALCQALQITTIFS